MADVDAYEIGRVLDELADALAQLLYQASRESISDTDAIVMARDFVTVEVAERLSELLDVEL